MRGRVAELVRFAAVAMPACMMSGWDCLAAKLEPQPPGISPTCAIEVEFRERNTEIDMRTLDRVLGYVETAPTVLHAYDRIRHGDEGPTLCLVIPTADEALAVFERLVILIPPKRGKLPRMKPPPAVLLRYNGVATERSMQVKGQQ